MPVTVTELPIDRVLFTVPESDVHRLRENKPREPIIGQDRALAALELGLGIQRPGYNAFIMGASGTGRRTVLNELLKNYKANTETLQDVAYAHNFKRPLEPKALFFPPGRGGYFRKTLQGAIESIRRQTLLMVKSEVFAAASKRVASSAEAEENQLLTEFEIAMAAEGFKVIQVKEDDARSMDLIPVVRGATVPFDELQERASRGKFPPERLNALREGYYRNLDRMSELFNQIREKRRATDRGIRQLKAESAAPIIDNELAVLISLCSRENENKPALEFLRAVREDLLSRIGTLTEPFKSPARKKRFYARYAVNLICEHGGERSYVIHEEVPTFSNLFGSIEPPAGNDDLDDGHLRLRPGAVHRAAGGVLVLRLQDLLSEEGAWLYLKRVLQSGKCEIQSPPSGNHVPSFIKPEALPVDLKVVIIGSEHSYDFLYQEDPDFQKLFKVCAEFDSVMPLNDENMSHCIAFIDGFARERGALPVADSGVARIIAHGARLSEYRTMLTTRFTHIADLVLESDFLARKRGAAEIDAAAVSDAIENRRYLHRLPEEKYAEMIGAREIVLDVAGAMVGKVNGLAVHDRGYHAFGIPVAVTAQAGPGNKGVINIERESGLSGEIYDKAHLIIQGLLHRKYARDLPLALSASICFEQSYTEVDGDSASCAEFYALLSAISGIPLRQDLAITGSLNQLGDVQPVGGVAEKIEGFFDTCSLLGLSGTQGVIVPARNENNLILADRVERAIAEKRFHLWAISTVDEGLEIFSGIPADDFRERVYTVLREYAGRMREYR